MIDEQQDQYPTFLRDYGGLLSHFNSQFADLNSYERGDKFVQFVQRLIPHSSVGERFEVPKLRQVSHDKGVDLECESKDKTEQLFVQSKYTIKGVDDIDGIISKFRDYKHSFVEISEEDEKPKQLNLLEINHPPKTIRFMIVTASDIREILAKYEKSKRPSLAFYKELMTEKSLYVINGPDLIPLLKKTYRKLHILPSDFSIKFAQPYIQMRDVYIGVISGIELNTLYENFGDSLFIENIREFLGSVKDRSSLTDVNREMLETLENNPERFLAKNNGITFRASEINTDDSNTIRLTEASIVNGLQTTMSVVQAPSEKSHVLVKVVSAKHSWEIAKAANFQNKIDRIDLDLAEYIRPRDIRTAASKAGIRFNYLAEEMDSVFAVLEVIYQDQVSYQEIRSLFIGLFSRNPNNTIDPDYGQLKIDLIEQLYEADPQGEKTFNALFKIQKLAQQAARKAQEIFSGKEYAQTFQRFWDPSKARYRSYLTILAMCGCVRENIYLSKQNSSFIKVSKFLDDVGYMVDNHPEVFVRYYRHGFKSVSNRVMNDGKQRAVTLQRMAQAMHRAPFESLFTQLCINADDDDILRGLITEISK